MKWYVIRTYSGHEKKAKTNIEKMVQARGMADKIGQITIPTIK
ncbi:MAG: transcription termination/antitermination factor NusG, partial [Leptospiraceae bacterium]|nr:transcription termination/antitermination factor NusG [Leptospiraceae bacterium]